MRSRLALFSLVVCYLAAAHGGAAHAALPGDPVIAAAGDIACDPRSGSFNGGIGTATHCRQLYTSDLLTQHEYAAVLPLGDLQYEDGRLIDFLRSYEPSWGRVKHITRPVPGNHEYHTAGASGYFAYFNGLGGGAGAAGDVRRGYYSYDIGNWHLVALNSNCGAIGGCSADSPQERWLREDLAASRSACTLAYWHHPLFSSGNYRPGITSVRPLFQALWEHGADVVLSGHDHNYERFVPQDARGNPEPDRGVRQFVVGTGGKSNYAQGTPLANSEIRNATSYGVLELTLGSSSYDWRFVPAAGDTFTDSGSERCRNAPPPVEYPRPHQADGVHLRLVPSFESCDAPNSVHGEPLLAPSCNPPVPSSAHLTTGTPDANGAPANFTGYLGLSVLGETPIDPGNGDQADVGIVAELTDVRTAGDLGDYAGELQGQLLLRSTDTGNGSPLADAATAVELPLSFAIPCTPTPDSDQGSDCKVSTSVDTLTAGAAAEGAGAVWELLRLEVMDGGADGSAATPDNTPFALPGLFAP